ncbi:MAG TPA: glycosyltransferase family 4 protein [bacterium]|nr:glycosyltransferase family 4 protein [bacterium]
MNRKKIKILRVIARLNVGGPAIQAISLNRELNNNEFESTLVYGTVSEGEEDITKFPGMEVERGILLPGLGRELHPLKDISTLLKLIAIIRRERPDIIHTHTAKAGAVGRLAAVLCGVPILIHTFHGHVFHGYFSPLKTSFFKLIEKILAAFTTRIIAISPTQKKEIQSILRIPDEKFEVIPLGFNLDKFEKCKEPYTGEFRRAINSAPDDIIITIIGRIVPIKNHALFLNVARLLLEKHNNLRFAIVGGGELQEQSEALARQLGISDRVVFAGWRSDIDKVYADTDITVLTSDNEGTPVCLIESLSAGVPVVSTDVGGVKDVVFDGRNGYLVPKGDAEAFASAVEKLIKSSDERARMGINGKVDAVERHSFSRLYNDIVFIYRQLFRAGSNDGL